MKIFVAYTFRDDWIKTYVIPLIATYGVEVLTGEDLPGQTLDEGVKSHIDAADVVIAFLTRVTQTGDPAKFKPSDWVVQEMTYADSKNKRILDVREEGVEFTGGLTPNYQRYAVNRANLAPFMLNLAKAISQWRTGLDLKLQLVSDDFIRAVLPVLSSARYTCHCKLRRGPDVVRGPEEAVIHREKHGLFVYARQVPHDSLIELEVGIDGARWVSVGTAADSLEITLERT